MATAARSALHLGGWFNELLMLVGTSIAAALGHVALLGVFMLLSMVPFCSVAPPAPEEIIQVSLVSLAKSDSAMAQMDVRVASAPAPVDTQAPAPEDAPGLVDEGTADPAPETSSDLSFQQPDVKEAKGDPDRTRQTARDEALNKLRRDNMLAALGSAESTAGDPNSTSSESINLGGVGISDPELARYVDGIRKTFLANFNPLPTIASSNPDIAAQITVRINVETGRVESWAWTRRSGNPSWDGACERAVEAVAQVPPPPAKYKDKFLGGYIMNYRAP
jgi:hypothetical protein